MGILIKDSIEFSNGVNASEIYGRFESIHINKILGTLETTILYYESKSISNKIGRKYFDSTASAWPGGPINHTITSGSVYDVNGSLITSGSEIKLPSFYEFVVTSSITVEKPVYIITSQSVEFTDFDATGSQFTNYRIESQSIQSGSQLIEKQIINLSQLNSDIYGYAYNLVKKDIKQNLLINSTIEDL